MLIVCCIKNKLFGGFIYIYFILGVLMPHINKLNYYIWGQPAANLDRCLDDLNFFRPHWCHFYNLIGFVSVADTTHSSWCERTRYAQK